MMPRLMPEPAPLDFKGHVVVFGIWLLILGTVLTWTWLLWAAVVAVWGWVV